MEPHELVETYKKVLPILDLMQATKINSGVHVGSGLIEWLQYGSLLVKLGYHREHTVIMHRCQAQLATAPYLSQITTQQENTLYSKWKYAPKSWSMLEVVLEVLMAKLSILNRFFV
ncbi:spermatogenesis-associated protein 16-like [Amphiprion ocellaris]|uniref:spermatogenesis-associated protein 16-like n=1 Tax=Amphiprion ocellaris TaxID=80972 RepID=UPI00241137FE|nr:spermatogenesis-associated protein 16-like [Amphiprion ocellaris]